MHALRIGHRRMAARLLPRRRLVRRHQRILRRAAEGAAPVGIEGGRGPASGAPKSKQPVAAGADACRIEAAEVDPEYSQHVLGQLQAVHGIPARRLRPSPARRVAPRVLTLAAAAPAPQTAKER